MADLELLKHGTFNDGYVHEIWPEDYIAGPQGTNEQRLPDGNWKLYKSANQAQFGSNGDKQHCVSRARTNVEEMQLNYLYQNNLLPQQHRDFLEKNGYINNGKVELHVRLLSFTSGTTRDGNSLSKVADTARKTGFGPSNFPAWPDDVNLTWDAYYVTPPKALVDLALQYLKLFAEEYYWVVTDAFTHSEQNKELMRFHMTGAPLQVATALCPPWNVDNVPLCGLTAPSHSYTLAFMEEKSTIWAFDHYQPFEKQLPWQYIIPYALKCVVSPIVSASVVLIPPGGVGTLLKKIGEPNIYMYGLDKMWHGLSDMDVQNMFKGPYDPKKVLRVNVLPSNISFTVQKQPDPTSAAEKKSLKEIIINFILNLFKK